MRPGPRDPDARLIYVLALGVTLPVVVIAFARRGAIGAGPTLCMLISAVAVVGLVQDWRRRVRLPRARIVSMPATSARTVPTGTHVLVIEDEPAIQDALCHALASRGLDARLAASLADATRSLDTLRPALVLLDLGLPDGDGMSVLRAHARSLPIIVVSARDGDDDRILALDAGAEDFVSKPFDARELARRVSDVMARGAVPTMKLTLDDIEIDFAQSTVARDARVTPLTAAEANALVLLAQRRGSLVGHRQLAEAIWRHGGEHDGVELRLVMAGLRRKVEHDPARPRWLVAEAGGYRLRLRAHATA